MKRYLLFSCLFFLSAMAFSQPFIDLAEVQYQAFTRENTKDLPGASAATSVLRASLTLPFTTKSSRIFILGFDHVHNYIDFDSDSADYRTDLYSTGMRLMMKGDMHDPAWSYLFLLVPKINADLKTPIMSDMQLGGAALFIWNKKENLKFKFGMYYNREYYGNYFMPLLGIEWTVNKRLNIFGILPGGMNIEYRLNPKMTCGLAYRSYNPTFRTEDNPGDEYVREGHKFWADNQVSVLMTYYPFKNIALTAGIGQTVFRYFQNYSEINIKINSDPSLIPIEDQQFAYITAAYRIRFDQEK
jgi:hypothetical protein